MAARRTGAIGQLVFGAVWLAIAWHATAAGTAGRWLFLAFGFLVVVSGLRGLFGSPTAPPQRRAASRPLTPGKAAGFLGAFLVVAMVAGASASFAVGVGVLGAFFVLLTVVARSAGQSAAGAVPGPRPSTGSELDAAAGAERLVALATELAVPGGRPREEVLREAAAVYEQLPLHVRQEIDRRAPEGWLGTVAPFGAQPSVAPPSAPSSAPSSAPPSAPSSAPPAAAAAYDPVTPVPGPPDPAPVVATPPAAPPSPAPAPVVEPAPAVVPIPATAPVAAPVESGDVRYSVLAPDVLTGDSTTPPGAVVEGWYITEDRTRERWHNGSSWTAHVRVRGAH